MKKFSKIFVSFLCAAVIALPLALTACTPGSQKEPPVDETPTDEFVDYVSDLHLDMDSESMKVEVEVRQFVDGDTTHFNPKTSVDLPTSYGYIKARYLAVNTPESTGKIEKWGKTASLFTKAQLSSAESIIIESDDENWNVDSTGERYLLWIWYKPAGAEEYRNLNVELLQYGYGLASKTGINRYGEIALAALVQAQNYQLRVFSPASTVDENFFDGEAVNLGMKELRFRAADYQDQAVRVEGTVTARFGNTAYIEDFDADTETTYGFAVYYGYQMGSILEILTVGNRVSVYGKVSEYNGTYQLSDVENNEYRPNATTNTVIVESDEEYNPPFTVTNAADIATAGKTVSDQFRTGEDEEGNETYETLTIDYREAIMSTSVTVCNLTVVSMYTTSNGGSNEGAISITCKAEDGTQITVRTQVLYKEDGTTLVTESDIGVGSVITVKGIIDKFNGTYQIAVHRFDYFTFVSKK